MTSVMIWPDVHREDGHWMPAINLAKSLNDKLYTVGMMGILDTQPLVTPYQIPFTAILGNVYPIGSALARLEDGSARLRHLTPIARGDLDAIFIGVNKPDVLVAGYFAALEALMIHHKYGVPLVLLTTFMRHPDATPASFAMSTLYSLPPGLVRKLFELTTGDPLMAIESYVEPLENAPEMIPMAEDFEFDDLDFQHSENVKYVEPMIERLALDGSTPAGDTPEYYPVVPPPSGVIYGACGSQVEVFEASARKFFENLIEMMKAPAMNGRHLVLSLGQKLYLDFRRRYTPLGTDGTNVIPAHVTFAPWVPQLEILETADAAFVHGGLATIKETIWKSVPMVVVPMVNDQFDNALRVQEGDLGVFVPLEKMNPGTLRSAFQKATTTPWIIRSVGEMQQTFATEESRDPKRSIEVIQTIAMP